MSLKSVVLIRTDLKMDKGKIAAQCGHAFVYAYRFSENTRDEWYKTGMTKIVLKVSSEEELLRYRAILTLNNISTWIVVDQGRTQIAPNTITCLGIEICDKSKLDTLLKDLKLL